MPRRFIESFNGSFRDKLLNVTLFSSLADLRPVIQLNRADRPPRQSDAFALEGLEAQHVPMQSDAGDGRHIGFVAGLFVFELISDAVASPDFDYPFPLKRFGRPISSIFAPRVP